MTPKRRSKPPMTRAAKASMAAAWVTACFALAAYAIHMGQDWKVSVGMLATAAFFAYRKDMVELVRAWKSGPAEPAPACDHDDAVADTPPVAVDDPDAGDRP